MSFAGHVDELLNLVGERVDNERLFLDELLGEGGYGKVYRAQDLTKETPTFYAVKCVKKSKDPTSSYAKLVARELAIHQIASGHPNVVAVLRTFSDDKHIFIVLDLAKGDLFDAVVEKMMFNGDEIKVKKVFLQVLEAVQHCHEQGIAHCDIKPENILCDSEGDNIMLADFGLATMSRLEDSGWGSSFYMSPECVGREFRSGMYSTNYCDIWALGILLINFLTVRNPWYLATSTDTCFSSYLNNSNWLFKVLPISSQVNELLKRVLHINPLCRIPLAKFREEIVEMKSFYKSAAGLGAKESRKVRRSSFFSIREKMCGGHADHEAEHKKPFQEEQVKAPGLTRSRSDTSSDRRRSSDDDRFDTTAIRVAEQRIHNALADKDIVHYRTRIGEESFELEGFAT